MTVTEKIKKDMVKLGLNETQAEVYLLLFRQGNMRINEITKTLSFPRSTVYEILKDLRHLGLVEEITENSFKKFQAYPIDLLKHSFQDQVAKLQQKETELGHVQKSLDKLRSATPSPPMTVRYYKGRSGARQIFWNSLKAKETIYVYSQWGRGKYLGIKFYQDFVSESYMRGFDEKVITNSTPQILQSIKQHLGSPVSRTKLENIMTLPAETLKIKGETLIYGNIYAQVYLKDDVINGFEIESKDFASAQRAIFETLQKTAILAKELI